MKDREIFLDFLRMAWRKSEGDVRTYVDAAYNNIVSFPPNDQKLLLQMAIAVAQMPWEKPKGGMLQVKSIVSAKDRQPYVCLTFGSQYIQMPAEDARQHAFQVMGAAAAAETDAFLFFYFQNLDFTESEVSDALVQFRRFRERNIQ
jgi:hypothetical protein